MKLTAESLIAGYQSYATPGDLVELSVADAPASTPAILSFIGYSSVACGGAVSSLAGSAISTIIKGC